MMTDLSLSDAPAAARSLLGCLLYRRTKAGLVGGMIVETEAYLGENDPASHSASGETERNATMYGPAGKAYIYLIYGIHHCLNVVTGPQGSGEAVLIRAIEPLYGLELMQNRRGCGTSPGKLCSGPGKICQAFAIDLSLDGHNLAEPPLYIRPGPGALKNYEIVSSSRIGINKARDLQLRYYLDQNKFVSGRYGK